MKSCCYIITSLMVICIIPSILSAVISDEHKLNSSIILRNDNSLILSATRSLRESRSSNMYREGLDIGNGGGGHGNGNRKRPKRKKGSDLMSKILPMMVMPFLISSSMIPMALTSLKFMLLKSIFVGKIAIFLIALNAFWRTQNSGGVYSHNINIEHDQKDLHMEHYGFNGETEVGAYVNRRSGKFR